MKYKYALVVQRGNGFPDTGSEKEADTWDEVISEAYKEQAFVKKFGYKVIRINYTEDGSQVKSMQF